MDSQVATKNGVFLMNYENRIVCFLDILGFKKLVQDTIDKEGLENEAKIKLITLALESIRDTLDIDQPEERPGEEITQFSDAVVISFAADNESGVFYALLKILWMQIRLALKGILCRGAVVRGQVVHTPQMLFGPAVIDAYCLESKSAIYPRVILDKKIVELGSQAHASHHRPEQERTYILNLLQLDCDGQYYINYLTGAQSELDDPVLGYPGYLDCLCRIIAQGLKEKDPGIAIKYEWMREKVQSHVDGVKKYASENYPQGTELWYAYQSITNI